MKILKENFDDFNIQARIIPALIIALPPYIYLIMNNIVDFNINNIIKNSIIFILLISVYYRIIRNLGKRYERKMYHKLGNKPTNIVLRYSDDRIDSITKTRYHKKLNKRIEGIKLPIKKENEKFEDDQMYESAINWLRNYANANKEHEIRTYQELKDYNFWRNLYGGKDILIFSCIVCIVIELAKMIVLRNVGILQVYTSIVKSFVMFFILIISCLIINKRNVEEKAFDYAITLLEVCERI